MEIRRTRGRVTMRDVVSAPAAPKLGARRTHGIIRAMLLLRLLTFVLAGLTVTVSAQAPKSTDRATDLLKLGEQALAAGPA